MINELLMEMYKVELHRFSEKLVKIKSEEQIEQLDGPLIMHCFESDFLASKKRILFIGQESNGWHGYVEFDLKRNIDRYKKHEMAKNGNYSLFWQYVYEINQSINPGTSNLNFMWTNVVKFSNELGDRLSWDEFVELLNIFNVLEKEIKILTPDVLIFLTGPDYDEKIKLQFDSEIRFTNVDEKIPVRMLARIESEKLPIHTYRTYHPSYLQRGKKKYLLDKIIHEIKK